MKIVVETKLNKVAMEDALNRIMELIQEHHPDLSENDVVKARYDDVQEFIQALDLYKEYEKLEDPAESDWLED